MRVLKIAKNLIQHIPYIPVLLSSCSADPCDARADTQLQDLMALDAELHELLKDNGHD